MATTLKEQLVAIRTQLKTDLSVTVELRDALPLNTSTGAIEWPTDDKQVILDLVGAAPSEGLGSGGFYSDLILQVGAYAKADVAAALDLANSAYSSLNSLGLRLDQGPVFADIDPGDTYRGVLATYRLTAAFNSFA